MKKRNLLILSLLAVSSTAFGMVYAGTDVEVNYDRNPVLGGHGFGACDYNISALINDGKYYEAMRSIHRTIKKTKDELTRENLRSALKYVVAANFARGKKHYEAERKHNFRALDGLREACFWRSNSWQLKSSKK